MGPPHVSLTRSLASGRRVTVHAYVTFPPQAILQSLLGAPTAPFTKLSPQTGNVEKVTHQPPGDSATTRTKRCSMVMMSLTALRAILNPGEREIERTAVSNAALDRRGTIIVFVSEYPSVGVVHVAPPECPCCRRTCPTPSGSGSSCRMVVQVETVRTSTVFGSISGTRHVAIRQGCLCRPTVESRITN